MRAQSLSGVQPFLRVVAAWACCAVLTTNHLPGQAVNANVRGTVTDVSGSVVPGAQVQVKNVGTGVTTARQTDSQGRFRVPELIVGAYEIQVTAAGFQTVIRSNIQLVVGSESVVDITLP